MDKNATQVLMPPDGPMPALRVGETTNDENYRIIRPYGSGDILILMTIDGQGVLNQDQSAIYMPTGTLAVFPAGIEQDYATDPTHGQWQLIYAHVSEALLDPLLVSQGWPPNAQGICYGTVLDFGSESLLRAWRLVIELAEGPFHHADRLARQSWQTVQTLLAEWMLQAPYDQRIQLVMQMLTEDPAVDLVDLAAAVDLSVSRFQHLFQEQTDGSIGAFRDRIRLRQAARLLDVTDQPIGVIAEACGYADALYFSRRFAKYWRVSPSHWRHGIRSTDS